MKSLIVHLCCTGFKIIPVLFALQSSYGELIEKRFDVRADQTLEVMLDVDVGRVVVQNSKDQTSCLVVLNYDKEEYRGKFDFDQSRNRIKVVLDKRHWHSWSRGEQDHDEAILKLQLPMGPDLIMISKMKAGEVDMQLGGLCIKELVLSIWAGELDIGFGESNLCDMEFFEIDAKVGEMSVENLGNARFKRADIHGGIGELYVDFRGDLLNSSRAKVGYKIGEATIVIPDDIGVRMNVGGALGFLTEKEIDESFNRRGKYYYTEDYDSNDRRLSLRVSTGLGELNIERE